jgi:hypothetical protein
MGIMGAPDSFQRSLIIIGCEEVTTTRSLPQRVLLVQSYSKAAERPRVKRACSLRRPVLYLDGCLPFLGGDAVFLSYGGSLEARCACPLIKSPFKNNANGTEGKAYFLGICISLA